MLVSLVSLKARRETMKIYTAIDIAPMGPYHQKYGQTYWGAVEEQEDPVRFNLMKTILIAPGTKLIAGEYKDGIQGAKTVYSQLGKVKVAETVSADEEMEETQEAEIPEDAGYQAAKEVASKLPRPENVGQTDKEEIPAYEPATNARWALKLSVDTYKSVMGGMPDQSTDWTAIEDMAEWLVGAFYRLKSYTPEQEDGRE